MKYSQLSLEERYFLSSMKARGISIPNIALELDRAPSTLYRELERNRRNTSGYYAASVAHSYAAARRRRVRRGSKYPEECRDLVYGLLKLQWSSEQVSSYLSQAGQYSISFQTIYRWIRKDRRDGGTLFRNLRIMPKLSRSVSFCRF